jgi:hypothetical protein
MKEEYRLRMCENEVMWRVFAPKRQEVTAAQKEFHEEVFHIICSSPNNTETRINWLSVRILRTQS